LENFKANDSLLRISRIPSKEPVSFWVPPNANYTGSYTTESKEIVDVEIAVYENPGKIITDSITMAPRTKF
jgi:hypothetical protein